jgi:release factor glutamine methyltransferase
MVTGATVENVIESLPKFIREKALILEAAGVSSPRPEVELILCHLLKVDRLHLFLDAGESLSDSILAEFDKIIERRLTRYPLQFILGEAWFYGRRFAVNEAVMAPTPETELLCENAIRFVRSRKIASPRVLDMGVGSGVISVTMAMEIPDSAVTALDISPEAIEVARGNARDLGAGNRVEFRRSDYFSAVRPEERFDLILSNPPYIAEKDYAGLPPEVLADPKLALTSGHDGLEAVRVILRDGPNYLAPGGRIMFEIGYDQSERVSQLTSSDSRYRSILILKDLNDIDRVVMLGCDE